jgi:hypothetical protein
VANPSTRQRLISEMFRQAAAGMPLVFARSPQVENALNAVGITWNPLDANFGATNPGPDGIEMLARAIEASRINANNLFIDALFAGEKHRQQLVLLTAASNATSQATAQQAEGDAIGAVTF